MTISAQATATYTGGTATSNTVTTGGNWVSALPASVKKLPAVVQLGLVLVILLILGSIPSTSKLAIWIGLAVLLDGVITGLK